MSDTLRTQISCGRCNVEVTLDTLADIEKFKVDHQHPRQSIEVITMQKPSKKEVRLDPVTFLEIVEKPPTGRVGDFIQEDDTPRYIALKQIRILQHSYQSMADRLRETAELLEELSSD